jgi:hypothetical protein
MRQRRMPARCLQAVAGLMLCLPLTQVAAAVDIIVNQADGAAGLVQALQSAREARQRNKDKPQAIRIVLKAGTYVLKEPLLISSADSGTSDAPLLIEPEVPGSVTLTGGATLPMGDKAGNHWTFTPPQDVDRATERAGGQLYVNGRRAVLAREPNEGSWMFVQAPSKDQLLMTPTDASKVQQLLTDQRDRAIINLMQSWTSGMHRAGAPTPDGNGLTLQPAPKWPMLMFGSAQRFFIENVPGALDAPGEWLATDGGLRYIPRKDDGTTGTAVWPRLPTLLRVHGDDNGDRKVRHVHVNGLKFAYTGMTTSMRGWLDMQAAADVAAAIEIDNAEDVRLTRCDVRHTGGYGVWLKAGVLDSEVSSCVMDDLGAGGIRVGMTQTQAAGKTGHNTITHNVLMHTGRTFPGAVALWVGKSGHNTLTDNVIGHTSYTGISVGWTWGYGDQDADGNDIKRNVLFDIGQGMLSDLGAIYTLGQAKGTEVSGNLIRQVQDYPFYGAGAWGIYNDEGSSNLSVNGNVVVGTRSGGYHLHYGRDNVVRQNLFAHNGLAAMRWSAPAKSGDWQAQDNAVSDDKNVPDVDLHGAPMSTLGRMGIREQRPAITRVTAKASGKLPDVAIQGGTGQQHDVWASTLNNARKTLSAAAALAGVEPGWLTLPPLPEAATVRPTLRWAWRFDALPEGPPPTGVRFAPNRTPALVGIGAEDSTGSASKCLFLQDGAAGLARYEPYVYLQPDVPTNNAVAEFEVKLDDASLLIHEWRDTASQPYKSILKFSLSAQKGLLVGDKVLAPLPHGEWLQVSVQAMPNQGVWALEISGPNGPKRRFDKLPLITPNAPSVGWVGWISDTDQVSRSCLKRIDIHAH